MIRTSKIIFSISTWLLRSLIGTAVKIGMVVAVIVGATVNVDVGIVVGEGKISVGVERLIGVGLGIAVHDEMRNKNAR